MEQKKYTVNDAPLYHGTSSELDISDNILKPPVDTDIQRECRHNLIDKVFLTCSVVSAEDMQNLL